MVKKKKVWYKRWWAITLFILIPIVIIGTLLPNSPEKEDSDEKTQLTTEQNIEAEIREILGSSNRNVEMVRQAIIAEDNGKYDITIDYNANDNIKTDYVIGAIHIDGKNLFENLFTKYSKINKIMIRAYRPFVDKYGTEVDAVAVNMMMTRDTANKITWKNIYSDNIPKISDGYFIHPSY